MERCDSFSIKRQKNSNKEKVEIQIVTKKTFEEELKKTYFLSKRENIKLFK